MPRKTRERSKPWQKPWDPSRASLELPHNPTTEKAYRGGKAIHLLAMGLKHGHEDPRWMTYRQAQENGWQVRKGEKGTQIEFWQFPDRQERVGNGGEGKGAEAGADDERRGLIQASRTLSHRQNASAISPKLWMIEDANPGALVHVTPK